MTRTHRRDELHDELVVLLRTGRELAPDMDHALADSFLVTLDGRTRRPPRRRYAGRSGTDRRLRRRFAVFLLAGTALFAGTPLTFLLHSHTTSPASMACGGQMVKNYPSMQALKQETKAMHRLGYYLRALAETKSGSGVAMWQRRSCP